MAAGCYLIGIAGPSGAGKSYLARHLASELNSPVLPLDHYYRDLSHLSLEERARSNFDEPHALEHTLLFEQVMELHQGRAIQLPLYDFSVHTRLSHTHLFAPSPYVVVEGLFTLYWPELRELFGTAVYVEMGNDTCLERRLRRDVRERGRSPESVMEQFHHTVAPMAERYVRPTRQFAHVTLSGDTPIHEGVARVIDHIRRNETNRLSTATQESVHSHASGRKG